MRQIEMRDEAPLEVLVQRGKIKIVRMTPPKGKTELVSWLCGAPFQCNTTSDAEYNGRVQYYRATAPSDIAYTEDEVQGPSYKFMWTTRRTEYAKPYCVACFISQAITLPEIVELVRKRGVYPEWYAKRVLKERLGVPEELWNDIPC